MTIEEAMSQANACIKAGEFATLPVSFQALRLILAEVERLRRLAETRMEALRSSEADRDKWHGAYNNSLHRVDAAEARAKRLEDGLRGYMGAVRDVFAIEPETKQNYAVMNPTDNDECLRRFKQLDATGKIALAALGETEGTK